LNLGVVIIAPADRRRYWLIHRADYGKFCTMLQLSLVFAFFWEVQSRLSRSMVRQLFSKMDNSFRLI
jgi:hypothetical protein